MKLSVIINSYFIDDEKPNILKRCMDSMQGADEILALATIPGSNISFAEGYNRIAKLATGDFIMVIGDNFICEGNLKDLCVPGFITVPNINNKPYPNEWMMTFCMPRNIFEDLSKDFGLYDPIFYNGSHWEDTDLWRRARYNHSVIGMPTVNLHKQEGKMGRTIGKIPNHLDRIEINKKAYLDKWGDTTLG
jgi:hypothetical protein